MAPQALSFASTKILPPRLRTGLLVRDALVARIAYGLQHSRLTLLCAAGGYGKSCAMAQTLAAEATRLRCAWIACSNADVLIVHAFGTAADVWWRGFGSRLTRLDHLEVWRLPSDSAHALLALVESSMQLRALVHDAVLTLGSVRGSVEPQPEPWRRALSRAG